MLILKSVVVFVSAFFRQMIRNCQNYLYSKCWLGDISSVCCAFPA